MGYNQQAILKTLLYSDLFDFPLTKEEIWRFLISKRTVRRKSFEEELAKLIKLHILSSRDHLYCLVGREHIITKREESRSLVLKKIHQASLITKKLSNIPTILFIGISGSLAVGDADRQDDIDLFIITQKNTLYTTRLLILAVLEAFGVRRRVGDQIAPDKICVNLLIDETRLYWPTTKQTLYTAHEIAQIYPLFDRRHIYDRFLEINNWIQSFLPNSLERKFPVIGRTWQRDYYTLQGIHVVWQSSPIAWLCKKLQLQKMRKHQTHETVTKHLLAFHHPSTYETSLLQDYRLKCQKVGLLTKF